MSEHGGSGVVRWLKSRERKQLLLWGSWFFLVVGVIQGIIGLRYLSSFTFPHDALGRIYTISAFAGHFIFLSYGAWVVGILPLTLIFPKKKVIVPLSVLVASFILSTTLLDSMVFADNRFHMSTLIMSILGVKTWGFGVIYLVIFLGLTTFLAGRVFSFTTNPDKRIAGPLVAGGCILCLLLTHGLHIWADANYYTPITRFTTFLPLYYPATAKSFMIEHGLASLEENRDDKAMNDIGQQHAADSLRYPMASLAFYSPENPLNICYIVIDALRADMCSQTMTPNIYRFSENSIVFKNHYSGGNSSRMGAFSMFYGLPSTYWKYVEGVGRPPVLIDRLQQTGYHFGIFSSAPLYRPTSLDRTVFSRISDLRIETKADIDESYARDMKIADDWTAWLDTRDDTHPFFGMLFFDAPTSKSYPPEYENLFPKDDHASKLEEKFRKYKTAIRFDDDLTGRVLADLQARQLLENTIVIVTADHGEEFDDNHLGFSGHGSAYSEFQLHVPLIVSWPGKPAREVVKRTSHNDLPATLMEDALGCTTPATDFCSGKNIFTGSSWDWMIVGSYYNFAILEPGQTTISYPGGYFEIRDDMYNVISNEHLNRRVLKAALKESGRFYKK